MPGFDKTGPEGQGPLTGRRMGKCVTNENSESNEQFGMGNQWRHGRGNGRGRGRRNGMGNGRGFRNRGN